MYNAELIPRRLDLTGQYRKECGESYLFFNRESTENFEKFYERRRRLGRIIFRQLRDKGYDLTSENTLELFGNIYDSIGTEFLTKVVDKDVSILQQSKKDNIMDIYEGYKITSKGNDIKIYGEEYHYVPKSGRYIVYKELSLDDYEHIVLLNPRNLKEEKIMEKLINSNHNAIVGYYGYTSDRSMDRHREDIEKLDKTIYTQRIDDIHINNGYAYILTNHKIS